MCLRYLLIRRENNELEMKKCMPVLAIYLLLIVYILFQQQLTIAL
jgi:hypothetical protein